MIIRLKVFEQTLSIAETKSVPRKGSKDYLALQFLFSSDWKDLNKVCYLQHGEVSHPIDVVDSLVEVPEWFTEQDSFDITLFGKSGTQEVPTNVVSLRLAKSNALWEQDAPEPQPSWIVKLIDLNNHPPVPGNNGYWMIWDTDSGAYVESELPLPAGGSGGTSDHSKLINRDAAGQHPMSAVTGLVEALDGKQPTGDYLTRDNLQSATNAALAQAKASGEFDGTDGTTPHIGENGNWYLGDTDTGKPSRGANGKDGAGMDVTGATVGQIAKITAVDDSGKPTAWEPVDMPAGGGGASYQSWSKVWTLAVAEDIAGFEADNIDLYGKSEIMIVFISDSTASRAMKNGRLYINGVDVGKPLFNIMPLKKDSHSYVIIGRADDGIEYTTMQATAEYQSYPWQGKVEIVHRMVSGVNTVTQWIAGSTIEITQDSATLGKGVTIEIYVR